MLRTGIEVDLVDADTDSTIATKMRAAIGAITGFITSGAAETVTITNDKLAAADDAADSTSLSTVGGAGFLTSITTTIAGVSSIPAWVVVPPGAATETFLANVTATGAAVATGSTWVTLTSTEVTWDDSTLPNHDAGAIFTVATGVFLVPTTGIYDLSASVQFEASNRGTSGPGSITGRRAIRQARIRNTTTAVTMAFGEEQAAASNLNPTQVTIPGTRISVVASDTIVLQVRHDDPSGLDIIFEEDTTPTAGNATWFTAHRLA